MLDDEVGCEERIYFNIETFRFRLLHATYSHYYVYPHLIYWSPGERKQFVFGFPVVERV